MDKAFQQLKTQVIDMCHGASSSSCENVFIEFEVKYGTLKGLFLAWREKPLRDNEKRAKSDILSCKISLEEKENEKGNERYVDTLSTNKLCTENMNRNNKDAFPT